jgi:hypothetical protein
MCDRFQRFGMSMELRISWFSGGDDGAGTHGLSRNLPLKAGALAAVVLQIRAMRSTKERKRETMSLFSHFKGLLIALRHE